MLIHRPAIYEHAAALIGQCADAALADAELLFQAHLAAAERYRLTHVVVGLDLYGGDVAAWVAATGQRPPAGLDALAATEAGSFPAGPQRNILSAARRLRDRLADAVIVQVPVIGPFSLAAQLAGFEAILMGLLDDSGQVAAALAALAGAQESLVRQAGDAGCGVTLFESAASPPLVRPADFVALVQPQLARLMAAAGAAGPPELIMGGATQPILADLLAMRPSLVICDPGNEPADYLAACRSAGVALRVNLEPRMRLAEHREEAAGKLAKLARLAGNAEPLYVATGVIPSDADPATVDAFTALVEQANLAAR